jgi:hypothetical protein
MYMHIYIYSKKYEHNIFMVYICMHIHIYILNYVYAYIREVADNGITKYTGVLIYEYSIYLYTYICSCK